MNIDKFFQVLNREHNKLIKEMDKGEELKYIIKKVNTLNIYSLKKFNKIPKNCFYNLIKAKRDKFVKEIGLNVIIVQKVVVTFQKATIMFILV